MDSEARPRLRPVEPVPVEIEGRSSVALRDPEELADDTAVVPAGVLPLLGLLDGTRTLRDIQEMLLQAGSGLVPIEALQGLADALDRCFLFENERMQAAREAREAAFAAAPRRAAAHAGAAYPEEAGEARSFFDAMLGLAGAPESAPVSHLIAPHIDLRLGAEVYGHAHGTLRGSGRPDVVVVLGVAHAPARRRFVSCRKDFETPFGVVRHDAEFLDALDRRLGTQLAEGQILHEREHSVEFQAVWLAHLWPGETPSLVPILVGSFHDFIDAGRSPSEDAQVAAFLEALRGTIAGERRRVVVIASVDLAHVGPRYGGEQGLDEAGERALADSDAALLRHVEACDAEGFFREVAADGNARNVCGVAPIYLTLRLAGGPGRLLRYGLGRIDPESGSVVSFAAVALP